jgi:signal transduction histidine kinase
VIEVRDEGMGMSPQELEHAFEKFFRSDRADVQEISGTGLGLYITKSLVQLLGGGITVESERGRGSRFRFWLRAVEDGAVEQEEEEEVA